MNLVMVDARERFLARIEEPDKHWKFSPTDVRERQHWDDYQKAFSEVLSNTSTQYAPWYVIPADRKWFMRIAAGAVILDAILRIDPQFPALTDDFRAEMLTARDELLAEQPSE
jgi:polyphosphate kinase 2 (PPK2 family)